MLQTNEYVLADTIHFYVKSSFLPHLHAVEQVFIIATISIIT